MNRVRSQADQEAALVEKIQQSDKEVPGGTVQLESTLQYSNGYTIQEDAVTK